jgi:hypothetical protein
MNDPDHKRIELLEAVLKLTSLLAESSILPDVYGYIAVLNQLRDKLISLGAPKAGSP